TLPSRLFDAWVGAEIHVEGVLDYGLQFGFAVAVGLCYSLGFALVTHLAIRAYWLALVGLKTSFPDGIHWDRLPMMGPASRAFYRRMIGDLGEVIDRVDRTASMLFAVTILVALAIVWTGLLGLMFIIPAALVGLLFHDSEKATIIVFAVLYLGFMAAGGAVVVLDRLVAYREARGQSTQGLHRVVQALLHAYTAVVPQRLIAPVQFTLQSNLGNRGFTAVYFVVPVVALLVGVLQVSSALSFSLVNRYQVITTAAVEQGMLSAHYESMRGPADAILRYPMIPSDRIDKRQLRLFIPHRPSQDNPLARKSCRGLKEGRNLAQGPAAARDATACLASMWTVTLDGAPVALGDFLPLERRDLGMRGLAGYLDLQGKPAGRHDLRLVWNAGGQAEGTQRERRYTIPFWYDPDER
ncbi:MAG TPA: hypothetical protein VGC74_09185, partial [Stenotrophomonas sp.]